MEIIQALSKNDVCKYKPIYKVTNIVEYAQGHKEETINEL